jgi:hypothetical protein
MQIGCLNRACLVVLECHCLLIATRFLTSTTELLIADGDPSISSLSKIAFQLHAMWRLQQTPSIHFEDQKSVYLQNTIENYETILERSAKGPRMGLDFESMRSFLSGITLMC